MFGLDRQGLDRALDVEQEKAEGRGEVKEDGEGGGGRRRVLHGAGSASEMQLHRDSASGKCHGGEGVAPPPVLNMDTSSPGSPSSSSLSI